MRRSAAQWAALASTRHREVSKRSTVCFEVKQGALTPLPLLAGAWTPTPDERGYYDKLFLVANSSNSGRVSGQEAVQFLSKSGLEVAVLKEVRLPGTLAVL